MAGALVFARPEGVTRQRLLAGNDASSLHVAEGLVREHELDERDTTRRNVGRWGAKRKATGGKLEVRHGVGCAPNIDKPGAKEEAARSELQRQVLAATSPFALAATPRR